MLNKQGVVQISRYLAVESTVRNSSRQKLRNSLAQQRNPLVLLRNPLSQQWIPLFFPLHYESLSLESAVFMVCNIMWPRIPVQRLRNPLLSNIIIYASEFHQKFNVKRFVPGIQKKSQAESAAHVIKCVFEIRHFKQRIPGLVGATCG